MKGWLFRGDRDTPILQAVFAPDEALNDQYNLANQDINSIFQL
jgi:hypothetical protein